jgi:hypothetical protein
MFCSIDSTGEPNVLTVGTGDTSFSALTVGTGDNMSYWEEPRSNEYACIEQFTDQYKEEEEDFWMTMDRREWREYLKSMWLAVLKMRQYFNVARFSLCKLYYRRLLFSISGWLGRKGYAKKN